MVHQVFWENGKRLYIIPISIEQETPHYILLHVLNPKYVSTQLLSHLEDLHQIRTQKCPKDIRNSKFYFQILILLLRFVKIFTFCGNKGFGHRCGSKEIAYDHSNFQLLSQKKEEDKFNPTKLLDVEPKLLDLENNSIFKWIWH
jgi:hypothetical protein